MMRNTPILFISNLQTGKKKNLEIKVNGYTFRRSNSCHFHSHFLPPFSRGLNSLKEFAPQWGAKSFTELTPLEWGILAGKPILNPTVIALE